MKSSAEAEVHHENDAPPDSSTPAEAKATIPHEAQSVGQRGIEGEAVNFSNPGGGIEVSNSQEPDLEGKMQQAACNSTVLSSKSAKECTDSIGLEAQAQQSTLSVKSNTPESSLVVTEKPTSSIDTTTPAEAETTSPHETQLVGQRGIGGFSEPGGIPASKSQESNLDGKVQQAASDASALSSQSVEGCTGTVGLEAQAKLSTNRVDPNTPETSRTKLATTEKSDSSTEPSDDSVVFAAFSQKECATVAANTKPSEFQISFLNVSQLSEKPDDHKEGDPKHEPQVTAGLPSDLKFGSFSDENSGGEGDKAFEEVDLVPTEGQRHAQQNMNDVTGPRPQPSLQDDVNSSLREENFDSSLHVDSTCVNRETVDSSDTKCNDENVSSSHDVENVGSLLRTQSIGVDRVTVDSSDTKLCGNDENISRTPEITSTSQSAVKSAESSRGAVSTPEVLLSDSLPPATAATSYSFHISNFVFQVSLSVSHSSP